MTQFPFSWTRWLPLLGIGAALLAAAGACGGGGGKSLSAEEYFKKVEAIGNESTDKQNAAAPSDEEVANLAPDELKQRGIEFLNAEAVIFDDAMKKVEDLNPPDDIQDAHDALVEKGNALGGTFRGFANEAKDVPPEQIEDFFNTKVFAESTFAPFDEACSALQRIAEGKNIDVDLNCTE